MNRKWHSRTQHTQPAAILLGGFVAGTIDIGSAALINWLSPLAILRAIASGILGRAAFQGGLAVCAFGLVLQWAMSLVIAAIYVAACEFVPPLGRRWLAGGLAYGVGIFFVMNYVVVPLSAAPHRAHHALLWLGENLLAMLLFGLIVAWFARGGSRAR